VRALTKRPLLLVLAVLILLDIVIVQTVLGRDDKAPVSPPAASATRTPANVMPLEVTPPALAANDQPTPEATSGVEDTPAPTDTPTPKEPAPADDDPPESAADSVPVIRVKRAEFAAGPFETVRMAGTYVGTRAGTILRVQQRQGGDWVDFPLPTTTDNSGDFTAYVELGSPGEHRIRIVDPSTHIVSESVTVVIS
jgi:hypothetical protein